MDVSKLKGDRRKRKMLNKNNSRGSKLNKIIKRKTKERANHKAFNYEKAVHKFNEIRQVCKPLVTKRLTAGRLKPKQTQEGMFLKGLRTQYVSRDSLNAANEARKNEDINKIIDLGGGATAKRGREVQKKSSKHDSAAEKTGKLKKLISIFDVKELSFNNNNSTDFDKCPLSPISFPFDTFQEEKDTDVYEREEPTPSIGSHDPRATESKIDYEEELKKFAAKYEERVGTDILPNIPGPDILETTIISLRNLYLKRKEELEKREESPETQFLFEHDQGAQSVNLISHHKEMNENFFANVELPIPEESPKFFHNLSPLGSNSKLLKIDHLQNNEYCLPPSFLQLFESPDKTDPTTESGFQPKEDNDPKRDLNFISPPIHFYPRNMF